MKRELLTIAALLTLGLTLFPAVRPTDNIHAQFRRGGGDDDPGSRPALQEDDADSDTQKESAGRGGFCGTREPDEIEVKRVNREVAAYRAATGTDNPLAAALPGSVNIPVYFHVIQQNGTAGVSGTGFVPVERLDAQLEVLNNAYAGRGPNQQGQLANGLGADTPFRFTRAGVDYTVNSTWYAACKGGAADHEMKDTLHQGTADDLNFYTNGCAAEYGYAAFPFEYTSSPRRDGVVCRWTTLPGGSQTNYNLGDAATHEVGHWLGLFHTFHGGCSEPGDSVSDTPAERLQAPGCPAGVDTCPYQPGVDNIDNFMNYTYHSCMFRFTPGQSARADAMWATYRAGK